MRTQDSDTLRTVGRLGQLEQTLEHLDQRVMERGLLWLPLLGLFSWLAWAGWNEYQKVEAYRRWAEPFERSKYDIYAVLGQAADQLTWGTPTRQAPLNVQTLTRQAIDRLELQINQQVYPLDQPPPTTGQAAIAFYLTDGATRTIPFTEAAIAYDWATYLHHQWLRQS